jgi:hypothetical protein
LNITSLVRLQEQGLGSSIGYARPHRRVDDDKPGLLNEGIVLGNDRAHLKPVAECCDQPSWCLRAHHAIEGENHMPTSSLPHFRRVGDWTDRPRRNWADYHSNTAAFLDNEQTGDRDATRRGKLQDFFLRVYLSYGATTTKPRTSAARPPRARSTEFISVVYLTFTTSQDTRTIGTTPLL